MKPPPFAYHAPTELDEAVGLLAEAGEQGKVLAGGQSLIPLLNMRLAQPRVVVDINGVAGLGGIGTGADGVRVGALVRHSQLEADTAAAAAVPLLRQGLRLVAHPVIRNRGTTVGSIVHADPAGEMPAVLALLDGAVELRGPAGARTVPAAEFTTGPMETALAPGEIAVAARFPRPAPGTGTAFVEIARRHGDYALCGAAAALTLDPDGRVTAARCCLVSAAPVPLLVDLTPRLSGTRALPGELDEAAAAAAERSDPEDDIHASADYRRHLARILTGRALARAAAAASADTTAAPAADTGAIR
ncbi:xanthine dehydrogenase family protein subunit M [Streptomonospora halophila]|uniref:Xanthine dehydrogenase family protein subunit M n=1 Tax=Streptomonospora halophila TaxID=427369 RepID=A0ABP9GFG7_9ACTN